MRRVERFLVEAGSPLRDYSVAQERRNQTNRLVREFMEGRIGMKYLRDGLSVLGSESGGIIIFQPGPIYGFLRKIGLSEESARETAEEERAHYRVAKEYGLNPNFVFEVSREIGEKGKMRYFFNAYVSYEIPGDDEGKLRTAIRKISLAPDNPSSDDLAKLP